MTPQSPPPASGDDEAVRVYRHLRAAFAGRRRRRVPRETEAGAEPFAPGRDPRGLGRVVERLIREYEWQSPLARAELRLGWVELCGEDTARHAEPVGIEEATLIVRCDSTAWAQQLALLRGPLLDRIAERYPDAGIEAIRFLTPNTPSWKHGSRAIPGRGPRDTYG